MLHTLKLTIADLLERLFEFSDTLTHTYLVGITENVGNTVYMNGSILAIRSSKYTLNVVEPF